MEDDKKILLDFLKDHHVMSLSTIDSEGYPWTCTVYYAVDDDFNFYFLSEPSTQHCENIKKNHKVSLSIADTDQKLRDMKVGISLQGKAEQVKGIMNFAKAAYHWSKANVEIEDIFYPHNLIFRAVKAKPYVIRPSLIKFLNEDQYGMLGTKVFHF